MNDAKKVNYSIENVHDSIVNDNKEYLKYTDEDKARLYKGKLELVNNHPVASKMLNIDYVRSYKIKGVKNFARLGIMPPELVITDDRIREMCGYQFWIAYRGGAEKRFTKCPGLGKHSSCPDFSPRAKEMREILNDADVFVSLQSKLVNFSHGVDWQFDTINKFEKDLNEKIGNGAVIKKFGAGPCQVCPPGDCLQNSDCRYPDKRTSALEACGVPVGQLCKDNAFLTGDKLWEIKWLKHWGFPHQTPKSWRLTFGVALKLS